MLVLAERKGYACLRRENALESDAEQPGETKKKIEGKREKWERGRRSKATRKKNKTAVKFLFFYFDKLNKKKKQPSKNYPSTV